MKEQQRLNIDMSQTEEIVCEKCGGKVFQEGVMLRKASRFMVGTEQDAIIPIPTFSCATCGNVNEQFYPKILK